MKLSFLFFIYAFIILMGCKNESLKDKTLPQIIIDSPIQNQHYVVGDTILIKGKISDINILPETGIHITSAFDNNEFLHLHYGLLTSNLWEFAVKHKITHTQQSTYTIEVEGIDDAGKESKKEVIISIN